MKTKDEYVEPTAQNAETIEKETKKGGNGFLEPATISAATEQKKKQDHFDELIDGTFDNKPILKMYLSKYIFKNKRCIYR